MAIQDSVVTLKGAQAAVSRVELFPQIDGSSYFVVYGVTKDANGKLIGLEPVRVAFPAGTPAIDNLVARALTELRKANALEI